ncbi:MAG: hypothetical protein H0X47_17265 [Nitrospirales bacterium]|nr:hypothetical protein [Nitrospirales bacterium]
MRKKRFTDDQIVRMMRAAETLTLEAAARSNPWRWKRQFGQIEIDDVREVRQLRQENARLKKVLAERDLEVEVMKEL